MQTIQEAPSQRQAVLRVPNKSGGETEPQDGHTCAVNLAIAEARIELRVLGFDNSPRGIFFAQLSVILARLGAGLPAGRSSLESLWKVARAEIGGREAAA